MGREFPTMEDEFELSLELSIGGCYAKSEPTSLERENSRSDFSCDKAKFDAAAAENGCEFSDLQRRREMQAMKRREARMKRGFKKSRGLINGGGFIEEDRVAAEAQQQLHGGAEEEPPRKREKSFFGENKVSWGDYGRQQAQFLLPVACPWVAPAGERDERNSGGETPGNAAASSPAVSHHQSTSQKGGSSSDTGSHSSSFATRHNDKVEANSSMSPPRRCIGSTSHEQSTKVAAVSPTIQSDTSKTGQGSTICAQSNLTDTTCSPSDKPSPSPTSSVINAPPNPSQDGSASPLHMPCVSTTGPDGRTITGFLYKYTKSEVSIMCVCHGSFFTPAEFVEHAGGVDVTHPLRHITVVPSAVR
ncbi:ninja-family protein 4-like [Salvia miltiorrhiza]|uniref:ninja-family protein 4-like n=1 Tax=Salvia miltiorrhiza TaxID=226208 RepID=UPI0025AB71E9|nr:ninja-family protein 4-like [Salvia miltiorrhiza]